MVGPEYRVADECCGAIRQADSTRILRSENIRCPKFRKIGRGRADGALSEPSSCAPSTLRTSSSSSVVIGGTLLLFSLMGYSVLASSSDLPGSAASAAVGEGGDGYLNVEGPLAAVPASVTTGGTLLSTTNSDTDHRQRRLTGERMMTSPQFPSEGPWSAAAPHPRRRHRRSLVLRKLMGGAGEGRTTDDDGGERAGSGRKKKTRRRRQLGSGILDWLPGRGGGNRDGGGGGGGGGDATDEDLQEFEHLIKAFVKNAPSSGDVQTPAAYEDELADFLSEYVSEIKAQPETTATYRPFARPSHGYGGNKYQTDGGVGENANSKATRPVQHAAIKKHHEPLSRPRRPHQQAAPLAGGAAAQSTPHHPAPGATGGLYTVQTATVFAQPTASPYVTSIVLPTTVPWPSTPLRYHSSPAKQQQAVLSNYIYQTSRIDTPAVAAAARVKAAKVGPPVPRSLSPDDEPLMTAAASNVQDVFVARRQQQQPSIRPWNAAVAQNRPYPPRGARPQHTRHRGSASRLYQQIESTGRQRPLSVAGIEQESQQQQPVLSNRRWSEPDPYYPAQQQAPYSGPAPAAARKTIPAADKTDAKDDAAEEVTSYGLYLDKPPRFYSAVEPAPLPTNAEFGSWVPVLPDSYFLETEARSDFILSQKERIAKVNYPGALRPVLTPPPPPPPPASPPPPFSAVKEQTRRNYVTGSSAMGVEDAVHDPAAAAGTGSRVAMSGIIEHR